MVKNQELAQYIWKDNKKPDGIQQNDMHRFLVKICEEAGPREPGSAAEHKAADIVKEEFEKHCDKVTKEEFKLAPRAFLSFTILAPLFVLIGFPFFWFYPVVSAIMSALGMFTFYMQFLRYAEFVDVFYPKKTSVNVIGEINPKEEWKQTLMFSAHLDSAYQFNFNLYMPKMFSYFLIGLPILLIMEILVAITFSITRLFGVPSIVFNVIGIVLAVIIIPMSSMLFWFKTKWSVMGANDNLSGIAITQGIAATLSANKDLVPNHTKILVVSFGSEEAGLRGAKRWVKRHKEELKEKPFYYLNIDSVAKANDIQVATGEVTLKVKYNPEIVEMVVIAAKNLGIDITSRPVPFGASDAAALAQGGFSDGTMMAAFNIDDPMEKTWYHTINDNASVVEPEALEKARKISIEFMKLIDNL